MRPQTPTAAVVQTAAAKKQHRSASHGIAAPSGMQQARDRALAAFIGDGLRALREAAGLVRDRRSPAKIKRELLAAREAIDSALWVVEYAADLRKRGER